jgi:hypothetical protein
MGHYSDLYEDRDRANLIRSYGPKVMPEVTEENLRYNIARANKAEAQLDQIKKALRTLKAVVA